MPNVAKSLPKTATATAITQMEIANGTTLQSIFRVNSFTDRKTGSHSDSPSPAYHITSSHTARSQLQMSKQKTDEQNRANVVGLGYWQVNQRTSFDSQPTML